MTQPMVHGSGRKQTLIAISTAVILLSAGCGSAAELGEGAGAKKLSNELKPVTISAALDNTNIDAFTEQTIKDALKVKYPHITLDLIRPGKGTTLAELITAGMTPDLIFTFNGNLAQYRTKQLEFDHRELAKTQNFDLSRFDETMIRDTRVSSPGDELYGIPISRSFHALYYNKDLFDKFGSAYPKEGMLWSEVVELAKKVTRLEGGVQYRGIDPGAGIIWISQPLSAAAVDYKTEKASVRTDQWKQVFELVKSMYKIPGNMIQPGHTPNNDFMQEKNLAMLASMNLFSALEAPTKEGLNWDVTQYPSYPERRNIFANASVQVMAITPSSKHKEDALRVIEVAVSDEVQKELSADGQITSLKNDEVKGAFGRSKPYLKDKHIQSIFKSSPVPYPIASQYRSKAEDIVNKKFTLFRDEQLDVNTALLQAEEEINKMIETERLK